MPCYSKIQTVLLDVTSIEQAADKLGINVRKINENTLVLTRNGDSVTLSRSKGNLKFEAQGDTYLVDELIPVYAKTQLVKFAKSKGYTVAAGQNPGEYQLIKYE